MAPRGGPECHALGPPSDAELAGITARIARRVARELTRRGLGPEAERPLQRLGDRVDPEDLPTGTPLCVRVADVSLHAMVAVAARDRHRLERLCRDVARPAVASERLAQLRDGRLIYRLKRRWRDGTAAFVFAPEEFVVRLATLVPPPRFHLARYAGVLAPGARLRARVVPEPPEGRDAAGALGPEAGEGKGPGEMPVSARSGAAVPAPGADRASPRVPRARRPYPWAELMRRVLDRPPDCTRYLRCGASDADHASVPPPAAGAGIRRPGRAPQPPRRAGLVPR